MPTDTEAWVPLISVSVRSIADQFPAGMALSDGHHQTNPNLVRRCFQMPIIALPL